MSANKKKKESADLTKLTGWVVMKRFGSGSKSEHDAVCLHTENGDFILRRVGANPFHDEALQQWVGKEITALGMISNYTFFAKELKEK